MGKLKDKLLKERRTLDQSRAELEREFSIVIGDIFLGLSAEGYLEIELPPKKTRLSDDEALKLSDWIARLFKEDADEK